MPATAILLFKKKKLNFSSRVDQNIHEEYKQHARRLFKILLKHQFGVGNFSAIRRSLAIELSNTNFIMSSIGKLHSSLQNAFVEFLLNVKCDWLPMLDILANCTDISIGIYVPNIVNAYVS